MHDHLVHFYHLHALDWVDVVSGLKADPKATSELAQSISSWPQSSPGYFRDVQARLRKFVESGQLGPFNNAYWGHEAYKLPPEANLMATAHYLEALDFQKEIVKIHTIFGGKNPHPNWLVGGVPCPINIDGTGGVGAINIERLNLVSSIIDQSIDFINQVYIPDLVAIAGFYKDWLYGGGLASTSLMSYGDIPERANDYTDKSLQLPRGVILNGKLDEIHEVDLTAADQVQEFVNHSWYKYADEIQGPPPLGRRYRAELRARPELQGHQDQDRGAGRRRQVLLDQVAALEGPRRRSRPAGPLRHRLRPEQAGVQGAGGPVAESAGRPASPPCSRPWAARRRAVWNAPWAAEKMRYYQDKLIRTIKSGDQSTANTAKWEPSSWPKSAKGVGFTEAPRGALGHWIRIEDTKIANYQAVVPTTWNGSPRDTKGNIGAFEASLLDTPVADPNQPLEILRTLHSFDPCLACSTHVMAPDGQEVTRVTVR